MIGNSWLQASVSVYAMRVCQAGLLTHLCARQGIGGRKIRTGIAGLVDTTNKIAR